jgi:hypothetical protein
VHFSFWGTKALYTTRNDARKFLMKICAIHPNHVATFVQAMTDAM